MLPKMELTALSVGVYTASAPHCSAICQWVPIQTSVPPPPSQDPAPHSPKTHTLTDLTPSPPQGQLSCENRVNQLTTLF